MTERRDVTGALLGAFDALGFSVRDSLCHPPSLLCSPCALYVAGVDSTQLRRLLSRPSRIIELLWDGHTHGLHVMHVCWTTATTWGECAS